MPPTMTMATTLIDSWQLDARREHGPDEGRRDRAGQAGEAATQHVREELGLDEVDAHPLGHVLVLADGHPGPAEARDPRRRQATKATTAAQARAM